MPALPGFFSRAPTRSILYRSLFRSAIVLAVLSAVLTSCLSPEPRPAGAPVALDEHGQPASLLSAFFGLDGDLPLFARLLLCRGAAGKDGMPVVLSHTIDAQTLAAEDFRVFTRSGAETAPLCVTLQPAMDEGEGRTVLLIGEFGDAEEDPPVKVEVVGELLSDGATGGPVSFRGKAIEVTPLEAGPSLVLAEVIPAEQRSTSGRGSACPPDTRQVVRVTWAGGVSPPRGTDAGAIERAPYRVTVERAGGQREEIRPAAIADLGDNDNNHHLCLDTRDPAISVSFPAGQLVDPNQDLNPATKLRIKPNPGGHGRDAAKRHG